MNIKILYQDRFLVATVKPTGVPSQPDLSGQTDMTALLREKCGCDIFCVHRLDTKTAGVMVYAKTSQAAGRLSAALSDESTQKIYIAKCRGLTGSGEMEDLLWHDKHQNKSFVADTKRAGAKRASLSYECLSVDGDGVSTVKVRLHTGRTHQIRVQLASRGYPVLGDGKYGSKDKCPLALSCVSLSFMHPFKNKMMDFSI